MATPSDFAGAAQELAQARRECGVAGIDGVLSIADEMSEADLMILLGPIHLGREPVGNPEIGTVFAQELLDHPVASAIALVDDYKDVGGGVPIALSAACNRLAVPGSRPCRRSSTD